MFSAVFIVALVLRSAFTSATSFSLESSVGETRSLREFDDLSIEVTLNKSEGLKTTWFGPGGRLLKLNDFTAIIEDDNKTRLEIWRLERFQSGIYSLLANDGKVTQWVNVTVIVEVIPLADESISSQCDVPLTVGRETTESCQVTRSQQRDIRWAFNSCQVSVIIDGNPHRTFDQCGELLHMTGVQREELLRKASESGEPITVRLLLQLGTDPSARGERNLTALHLAIAFRNKQVVRVLIAAGSDLEARDVAGRTPLHSVAWVGEIEIARELIAAGSDLEAREYHDSRSPLHLVAYFGFLGVEKELIAAGSDLGARDIDGRTPLHLSVWLAKDGARELILAGSDLEARDNESRTPLHLAARDGKVEVVRLLIAAGSDLEARDNGGTTPLFLSARNWQVEVVRVLIDAGSDLEASDNGGTTPLHQAAMDGYADVCLLLLDSGANLKPRDKKNRTPLDLAMEKNKQSVVELLRERGA